MDTYTALYNLIYKRLGETLGVDIYDIPPKPNAPYPFVIIEPFNARITRITKSGTDFESVKVYLNVYDYKKNRGNVGNMLHKVEQILTSITEVGGFKTLARRNTIEKNISIDRSTQDLLLQGSFEIEMLIIRR